MIPVLLIPAAHTPAQQVDMMQLWGSDNQVNFLGGASSMNDFGIKSMGGSVGSSRIKPMVFGDITTPNIHQSMHS